MDIIMDLMVHPLIDTIVHIITSITITHGQNLTSGNVESICDVIGSDVDIFYDIVETTKN